MSENRKRSLANLKEISGATVVLVTKDDVKKYIVPNHPLHPAYKYLTETHKADYLRTYFMHFHGGGYSDIKETTGSWRSSFDDLEASDKWVCGYKEVDANGVGYEPAKDKWELLIGNGAYICKPNTPLTRQWYNEMVALLDKKLPMLKDNPGKHPQDRAEDKTGYPIGWNEMLGQIFQKACYEHIDKVMNTLPVSVFHNYH